MIKTLNYEVKTKEPSWNFLKEDLNDLDIKKNCKYINEKENLCRYNPKKNIFIKSSPRKFQLYR